MNSDIATIRELERELSVTFTEGDYQDLLNHVPKRTSYATDNDGHVIALVIARKYDEFPFPSIVLRLTRLRHLSFAWSMLTSLPPEIASLSSLKHLNLRATRLKRLPREILDLGLEFNTNPRNANFAGEEDQVVRLARCPLESPPLEIVVQGRNAVRNYFDSLEASDETVTLREAKLLVVGRGEVGKTCLMKKLIDRDYEVSEDEPSTEGIEIEPWRTGIVQDDKTVDFTFNFWDFGGQEIYHSTHQFFLTKRSLYVFVWDARKGEDHQSFDYWLNTVRLLSDSSPTIMVMNKADERVAEIEQQSIQAKFPNVVRFHQVSALTNHGIDALRADILRLASELPHIGDEVPKVWIDVRSELSAMSESVISFDDYLKIAEQHGLSEQQALFLSDYFHDLGIFLHFAGEELLEDIAILKPEWGTNAVYNVLDDSDVQASLGRFTRKELAGIWEEYEKDKHPHLLRLMMKFELCFEMGNTGTYIVPELMSADPPDSDWESGNNLDFEYRYAFMPAGIITRFIVRQHENIHRNLVWKNGVQLEIDNTRARVVADNLNRKIVVRIEGKNRVGALAVVRNEIEHIHRTLNAPDVSEMVPCICSECRASEGRPHFFPYDRLEKFLSKGKTEVTCDISVEDVSLLKLLQGVDFSSVREPREWDVFISYSSEDADVILEIVGDLGSRGIRYWWDKEQVEPGDDFHDKIVDGLRRSRYVMPCFSRSQAKSGWVRAEYKSILNEVIAGRTKQKVIPLILDDFDGEIPLLMKNYRSERHSDAAGYKRVLDVLARR